MTAAARVLPAPEEVALPRMKSVEAAVLTWDKWRKGGNAPKSREEALKIVGRQMHLNVADLKSSIARGIKDDNGKWSVDDRLSFIVWDILENGAALIDYSRSVDRILSDLLWQAGQFISTYMRKPISMKRVLESASTQVRSLIRAEAPDLPKRKTITAPSFVSTSRGYRNVADIVPSELERLAENFVGYAVASLVRWKAIGADAAFIRRTFARAQERVLEEFEN